MPIRLSQKPFVNIPHETDKCKPVNTRDRTFITSCINELKKKGQTICFNQSQIEEIRKLIDITDVTYDEGADCYYVFSKRQY